MRTKYNSSRALRFNLARYSKVAVCNQHSDLQLVTSGISIKDSVLQIVVLPQIHSLYIMSDLFTTQTEILRALCDEYVEQVADQPVRPLDWQGCHSYTVESQDGCTVIRFRSAESPLEEGTVNLAKKAHPGLVPTMEYLGFFDDNSVTVWKMDKVPGIGFGFLLIEDDAEMKLAVAVTDMAE